MDVVTPGKAARIAHLNDLLRCQGIGGHVMVSAGVDALGLCNVVRIVKAVADFTEFTSANDPFGERDCAVLPVDGNSILFKIDYFDKSMTVHSPDPADPKLTVRVLTLMLLSEY